MKYKAIASNSKIYFGKDIPNMFMDSAGGVGKQFEGLADKLSFVLEDEPMEADSENWVFPSTASSGTPRDLYFLTRSQDVPSLPPYLLWLSSTYHGEKKKKWT